ncbi:Protein of unknown function [Pyronema omphalodes CBS 100304]|uniref:Uncharacterized protein n=1 Tax=Pyronema omphalodes (strain CBS 100304) TaxID=1076935 RepID=U4L3S7_PYROM|nr:Protein of unknown function [Pyronema omphalodes CBS 100304]
MGLSDQEESEERCGVLMGTKEGSSGSSGSRTSRAKRLRGKTKGHIPT